MSEESWFSAMVRFALIVDGQGAETYLRSLFVFRAPNWQEAKATAVQLGRQREDEYHNHDGDRVALRLVEIETLDMLSKDELNGAEIYSEPIPAGDEGLRLTIESRFSPLDSNPAQTGVN